MRPDEFAFVNQQLAGMLKCGIPLEGALKQICENMRSGNLRTELMLLETDLAQGIPINEALQQRKLPAFYIQMIKVGVASNNLPGVLNLLADYYQRVNNVWTRLKGLMVYPVIVLIASLGLSVLIAVVFGHFLRELSGSFEELRGSATSGMTQSPSVWSGFYLWFPVTLILALNLIVILALALPSFRRALRWRFPAFREAGLSHLAAALALMLKNGCSMSEALQLLISIEAGTIAAVELKKWDAQLAAGHKDFSEIVGAGKLVPPLFVWIVTGSGENWIAGFEHAAEVFHARATSRVDTFLYAVLPCAVLALGFLILVQAFTAIRFIFHSMRGFFEV